MTAYVPVYPAQMRPQPKNGLGVAALVLGIIALVLAFIPFVSLFTSIPLGILGAIFAIIGLVRVSKGIATNKVMTIFGLVASVLAIILALTTSILLGAIIGGLSEDTNQSSQAQKTNGFAGSDDKQADEPKVDQFPGQTADDIVGNAGEAIVYNNVTITAEKLKQTDSVFGKQLCAKVTITNDGDSTVDYNMFDWKLQYPSGDIKEVTIAEDDALNSGEIAPGGSADGNVCFDGVGDSGKYALINEEIFDFGSERAVWITER